MRCVPSCFLGITSISINQGQHRRTPSPLQLSSAVDAPLSIGPFTQTRCTSTYPMWHRHVRTSPSPRSLPKRRPSDHRVGRVRPLSQLALGTAVVQESSQQILSTSTCWKHPTEAGRGNSPCPEGAHPLSNTGRSWGTDHELGVLVRTGTAGLSQSCQ